MVVAVLVVIGVFTFVVVVVAVIVVVQSYSRVSFWSWTITHPPYRGGGISGLSRPAAEGNNYRNIVIREKGAAARPLWPSPVTRVA